MSASQIRDRVLVCLALALVVGAVVCLACLAIVLIRNGVHVYSIDLMSPLLLGICTSSFCFAILLATKGRKSKEVSEINRAWSRERQRVRVEVAFLQSLLSGETSFCMEERVLRIPNPSSGWSSVTNTISALLQQTDQRAQSLGNRRTAQSVFTVSYEPIEGTDGKDEFTFDGPVEPRLVRVTRGDLKGESITVHFPTIHRDVVLGGDA